MSADRDFDAARAQYKDAAIEFVPVRSGRGKRTHATSLVGVNRTLCGKQFKVLIAVAHPLDCPDCICAVGLKVRRRRKRKTAR